MAGSGVSIIPSVRTINIVLQDEEGNPLPPEALVAVYGINDPARASTLVDSVYVGPNSTIAVDITVGQSYRLQFYGQRIPSNTYAFVLNVPLTGTTCVVNGYISPVITASTIVSEMQNGLLPDTWADWMHPNNIVVEMTLASLLGFLFGQLADATSSERLESSEGNDVDTWAADFFGGQLLRLRNEPDDDYIARVESELTSDNATLAAIAAKVRAFLVLQAEFNNQQVFALDTSGGMDTYGGLDTAGTSTIVPTVTCFDWQSNPIRANEVGLNHGAVCILLTYPGITKSGFFVNKNHLNFESYLVTAAIRVETSPSPLLVAYVNSIKALGTDILYCDNRSA